MAETSGSWPFIDWQCPSCHYFHAYESGRIDDQGYELPGFCRHPRIAMELFAPPAGGSASPRRHDFSKAGCSLHIRGVSSG